MANNGGMEATAPAWNDQDTSNLHRTAERDTILEELLVKARKENEDIARRMRKILGEDIGGSIDGSVVEKLPALKQTESLEVKDTHTSKVNITS